LLLEQKELFDQASYIRCWQLDVTGNCMESPRKRNNFAPSNPNLPFGAHASQMPVVERSVKPRFVVGGWSCVGEHVEWTG
jgi:hypothetical protein